MTTNLAFENIEDSNDEIKEVDHVSNVVSDSVELSTSTQRKDYIVLGVLFIINLLNYIDRFTVAGVLDDIKEFYTLDDKQAGMLQTVFIITYTIASPIFGYIGDRYSRKILVIFGVSFWSIISFSSSFIPKEYYTVFLVLRSLVGVGEASYSTVAPTIISDMFTSDKRTKMMGLFYFAVPVGSGLGFIIGYGLKLAFNNWQYALRLSPLIGIICVLLLIFFVREPVRGREEGGTHLASSPYLEDIRQLSKNKSFMFVTFGFTCVCFITGALVWFGVIYMNAAIDAFYKKKYEYKKFYISFIFGGMTMVAGILGVLIGTETGRRLRHKYPSADPLVCAFGMIFASPLIVAALTLAKYHMNWSLAFVFLTQTSLCLNWALVTDMTMSVVIPTRRATAAAYQMILSHAFGDAGSPYILGAISDAIENSMTKKYGEIEANYYGYQYSLFINAFICVIGCAFFLFASFSIVKDKSKVLKIIEESRFHYETVGSDYEPEDSQVITSSIPTPVSEIDRII